MVGYRILISLGTLGTAAAAIIGLKLFGEHRLLRSDDMVFAGTGL